MRWRHRSARRLVTRTSASPDLDNTSATRARQFSRRI